MIENNYSIEELAEKLIEYSKGMDFWDYKEEHEKIKNDIENALYNLKAIAQNEYNQEYWRTFWDILQNI